MSETQSLEDRAAADTAAFENMPDEEPATEGGEIVDAEYVVTPGPCTEAHDSLYRAKMRTLAEIVDQKQEALDLAAAAHKVAKAEWEAAMKDLHKAAKDNQEYLPFGHPEEGGEGDGPACNAPACEDDSWRVVPLTEALPGLSKGIFDSFAKTDPPLVTMGDLGDWTNAENQLTDIPGIGKGKAEKIEEAMLAFWERRSKEQQSAAKAKDELAALKESVQAPPVVLADGPADQLWKAEGEPLPDFGTAEVVGVKMVNAAAIPPGEPFTLSNDPPQAPTSHVRGGY